MSSAQIFILGIIAVSTAGWVVTTWIRARHGYPLTDDIGRTIGQVDPEAERKLGLLAGENDRLHSQIGRLEERLAVLERIATDPADRVSRDIESLR